jgi:cephalosporin hydroxylase
VDPEQQFRDQRTRDIAALRGSGALRELSNRWIREASAFRYIFNFDWLGRPIIQVGADMVAVQEAVWRAKPDLIIETGIAHGGSLIFHASLLALLDLFDARAEGVALDPREPRRKALGVDIEIRPHNRRAIEAHPLADYVVMIEGSSTSLSTLEQVRDFARGFERVMVLLDSNHTEAHVLEELLQYADLVTPGSYCVVFDTAIEHMPADFYPDRAWHKGNSPLTAVEKFLMQRNDFVVDSDLDAKILVGNAPGGFLRRLPLGTEPLSLSLK